MVGTASGQWTVTQHFEPEIASAEAARAFLRDATAGSGIDQDAAILAGSELVTNAIRHAQTPFTVGVTLTEDRVHIAVTDASTDPAVPATLDMNTPGGLGMHVVARLASAWGTTPFPGGKTVWFETPRPRH